MDKETKQYIDKQFEELKFKLGLDSVKTDEHGNTVHSERPYDFIAGVLSEIHDLTSHIFGATVIGKLRGAVTEKTDKSLSRDYSSDIRENPYYVDRHHIQQMLTYVLTANPEVEQGIEQALKLHRKSRSED